MSENLEHQPPKRTIDERIDALTMSMELHAAMMRDVDLRLEKMGHDMNQRLDKLTRAVEIDAENIRALARIAEAHQHRIVSLESGHSSQ